MDKLINAEITLKFTNGQLTRPRPTPSRAKAF